MSSQDPGATSRWIRRIRSLAAPKDRPQLRELLRDAQRQGLLDGDALSMLEGVLDVADLQVRDIMVPHNQMICVHISDTPQRMLQAAIESGHSRFPVRDEDSGAIVGILLAKDLLRLHSSDRSAGFDLRRFLRKAVFVPESKRVNVLLKELRMGRNHMAMAVDEYGGIAGLVTIEDVIEQIVGEIDDEYDVDDEKDIRPENDRQFAVRGATRIGDFNAYFGANFPDDEFDTVAGLVTQHFGRLPRRGEAATLDGFEFRVVRADRRCIEGLRVTIPEDAPGEPDEIAGSSEDSV
ncbi:MAG: transporter associated domain-containing protein [Steroidobacteraceae bacterium]